MKNYILKILFANPSLLRLFYRVKKLKSYLFPKDSKLLFTFSGRSNYSLNMGKELFDKDPNFKKSILESNDIIMKLGGKSILANFQPNVPENFFDVETNVYLTIASIQIGIYDIFKSKKIIPDSILGHSMGEGPALYCAGAFSKESLFEALNCMKVTSDFESKTYISVLVNKSLSDMLNLFALNKKLIHPVYENTENTSISLVDETKMEELKHLAKSNKFSFKVISRDNLFPYHTEKIDNFKDEILKCYKKIKFYPLKIDYYSGSNGDVIKKGTVINDDFLYNCLRLPVFSNSTFLKVGELNDQCDIIQVGSDLFGIKNLENALTSSYFTPNSYNTLSKKNNKKLIHNLIKTIKKRGKQNHILLNKEDSFSNFINDFDINNAFYSKSPTGFWNYFKKTGNIHYIPKNNCWLILDYQTISHILKTPEIFSSKTSSFFDPYLIGADAPSHGEMRQLLQFLFSNKSLKKQESYAKNKAKSLVENLPHGSRFNFVDYFSLPLSKGVTFNLLGLNNVQSERVNCIVGENIYEINDALKHYFSHLLTSDYDFEEMTVMNFLNGQLENNSLTLDEAATIARLIFTAGVLTTSILLSHLFSTLLQYPALINDLENSDKLLNRFIDEVLRLNPPETVLSRITTKPTTLNNIMIPENSVVTLDLRAANSDSLVFPEPQKINLNREANKHLAFGTGPHVCIGMALAKIEAKIAITNYFKIIKNSSPKIEHPIKYYESSHFRGPQKMIITLH